VDTDDGVDAGRTNRLPGSASNAVRDSFGHDMSEHAELDLPLSSRYATTVRAVAASMAATLGMSVDDIDDLRLGVNEAISVVTDVEPGHDGRLHVRFTLDADAISVVVDRRGVDGAPAPEIDALAERILGAVVDEYSLDDQGVFLLVKRVPADGDA
jgi:serine/threonine-protein kinase RsbW